MDLAWSRANWIAKGGDQLVLAHGRTAFDVQLTRPVPQLIDAARFEAAPIRLGALLAVLLARLGPLGLGLAGGRLLGPLTAALRSLVLGFAQEAFDIMQAFAGAGFDCLDGGVDLSVNDADQRERELALSGERPLGEVEPTVHGGGEVDAGYRQGKASGQLLGDVGPAADHVNERRLALADGAQEGGLRVVIPLGLRRHGWFLSV